MPLSEDDRIRMLEAIAEDEDLKATQRLRALEELGRIEARRAGNTGAEQAEDELAPDPMADLDAMETDRVKSLEKRRRRKAATA